jgi:hypothetical protein
MQPQLSANHRQCVHDDACLACSCRRTAHLTSGDVPMLSADMCGTAGGVCWNGGPVPVVLLKPPLHTGFVTYRHQVPVMGRDMFSRASLQGKAAGWDRHVRACMFPDVHLLLPVLYRNRLPFRRHNTPSWPLRRV